MSFPNVIDGAALSPNFPAFYGPFFNGSAAGSPRFVFTVRFDTGSAEYSLFAEMSTDGGVTWAVQDAANGPQLAAPGNNYGCAQIGDLVYVFFPDPGSPQIVVWTFSLTAMAWEAHLSALSGTLDVNAVVARAADLVLVTSTVAVFQGVSHNVPAFAVFDVAGNSWSSITPLGVADYATSANWTVRAAGAVLDSLGFVQVLTEQSAWPGDGEPANFRFDADDTFVVPADCPDELLNVLVKGGGAGGDNAVGGMGGGAGGLGVAASMSVTVGQSITVLVGAAGAGDGDGGGSSFNGLTSTGGTAGNTTGAGGTGTFNGGSGVVATIAAAGNGGGDATPTSDGIDGAGGPGGTFSPPTNGHDGAGGGGNGESLGHGGMGGPGYVSFSYDPIRGDFPGRAFIQSIDPSNALGSLVSITRGEFPESLNQDAAGMIPSAIAAGPAGLLVVCFSGSFFAGDNDTIAVGTGTGGAGPDLSDWVTYDNGNDGTGANCSPSLAVDQTTGDVYLAYISTPGTPPAASLVYRKNGGSAIVLGSGSFAGSLLVAAFLVTLQLLLGTATVSENVYANTT